MAVLNTFPLDNTDYSAKDVAQFFATRTAGVYSADDNLGVTPFSGMQIKISSGLAWLKWGAAWGVTARLAEAETLTLATAHATLHRIDAVIVRADILANEVKTMIVTGALASSPVAPAPVRSSQYFDIVLAHIRVNAGTTGITAAMITDKRLDESVCGVMRDGVTQIPTSTLQAQAGALINRLETDIHDIEAGSATMLKAIYDPAGHEGQMAPLFKFSSGSWTPAPFFANGTIHDRKGCYLKMDDIVVLGFYLQFNTTSNNDALIQGLPFPISYGKGTFAGGGFWSNEQEAGPSEFRGFEVTNGWIRAKSYSGAVLRWGGVSQTHMIGGTVCYKTES